MNCRDKSSGIYGRRIGVKSYGERYANSIAVIAYDRF